MVAAPFGVILAEFPAPTFVAAIIAAAGLILGAAWLVRAVLRHREIPVPIQLVLLLVGCAVMLGLAFGRLVVDLRTGVTVEDFGASVAALLVSAVCILLLWKIVSKAKPSRSPR